MNYCKELNHAMGLEKQIAEMAYPTYWENNRDGRPALWYSDHDFENVFGPLFVIHRNYIAVPTDHCMNKMNEYDRETVKDFNKYKKSLKKLFPNTQFKKELEVKQKEVIKMNIKESEDYLRSLKSNVANVAYEFNKPLIKVINETKGKLDPDCRSVYDFDLSVHGFKSGKHLASEIKETINQLLSDPVEENEDYVVSLMHRRYKDANPNVSIHFVDMHKMVHDREEAEMRHAFELALEDVIGDIERSFK